MSVTSTLMLISATIVIFVAVACIRCKKRDDTGRQESNASSTYDTIDPEISDDGTISSDNAKPEEWLSQGNTSTQSDRQDEPEYLQLEAMETHVEDQNDKRKVDDAATIEMYENVSYVLPNKPTHTTNHQETEEHDYVNLNTTDTYRK